MNIQNTTYKLNAVLNIPFVIPHHDKSNFVNLLQYGSSDMSNPYENEDQ